MPKINSSTGVSQAGVSGAVLLADGRVDALNSATPPLFDSASVNANLLDLGEETVSRYLAGSIVSGAGTSGSFRLTYFTARRTEVSTQVRMYSGSTAAGATPTLVRIGIYTIDSNGDGTLVAATANDTTVFAATNTAYTRSWATPFTKVAGQRYAIVPLVVSGAAIPTIMGFGLSNGSESALSPRLSGALGGQTDLPSTFTAGSLTVSGQLFYAAILP